MLRRCLSHRHQIGSSFSFPTEVLPAYTIFRNNPHNTAFSTTSSHDHWIDRFTGVRDWLEDATRRWWIKGLVEARCKQHHQLEGRELIIRQSLETEYERLFKFHEDRIVDSRSRTHLSVACLAMATHKTMLSFLRDEGEVMSAYEDRPNKALIVIDVQNGVVDFSRDRNVVVAKIAGLVDRARTAGVKVIWVQHSEDDMPIDSEYWQIVAELNRACNNYDLPDSRVDLISADKVRL